MNLKTTSAIASAALLAAGIDAEASENQFHEAFADSTLRLDCIFSGTAGDAAVSLSAMHAKAGWAGRTAHLDSLLYDGDGQVTVTTLRGDTIYRNSFSSLFNEWLALGETTPTAMEFTVLTPFPKDTVDVAVRLLNKAHAPIAECKTRVAPSDILIRRSASAALPHKAISTGRYDGTKIKVAFLAEGYTKKQMREYIADCQKVVDALFAHEPFAKYKERFDFIAVESPSADSGVSVPKYGIWKDTAFKAHYSTFYSDRYLTSGAVHAMHDALNGIDADHIIVLANSDEYGGGGVFNAYTLTTAHNPNAAVVAVHEFGHSFGALADEYFYPGDTMEDSYLAGVEPWEPNITTLTHFNKKWEGLLKEGTPVPTPAEDAAKYPVGAYEGGGYSAHGVYRAAINCRMKSNEAEAFCPACQAALEKIILFYTE